MRRRASRWRRLSRPTPALDGLRSIDADHPDCLVLAVDGDVQRVPINKGKHRMGLRRCGRRLSYEGGGSETAGSELTAVDRVPRVGPPSAQPLFGSIVLLTSPMTPRAMTTPATIVMTFGVRELRRHDPCTAVPPPGTPRAAHTPWTTRLDPLRLCGRPSTIG